MERTTGNATFMRVFPASPRKRAVLPLLLFSLLALSSRTPLARAVVYVEEFLSGFDRPIAVKSAGDGSDRLFVLERAGTIRIIENGQLQGTHFLDITGQVDTIGEGGLVGLAFHPNFAANGIFFVCYTASEASEYRVVVSRFHVSGSSRNQADPREEVILDIDHQTLVHNGGELAFGRDGYLYISVGDGAFMEELGDLAQDLTSLSGKILRIDVDQDPYGIPPDNPFVGHPDAREEIWAYGFRNPFRMSFDRFSGRLFVGDVGENRVEEIDLVLRGGNYGWRHLEGGECFPPSIEDCDREGLEPPIAAYAHDDNSPNAVIGGLVYRGGAPTGLWGSYLFSDFISGKVWELQEVFQGRFKRRQVGLLGMPAASWGEDEQGEIFIPGLENGKIFKLLFAWIENYAQVVSGVFGQLRMTTRFDFHNLSEHPVRGVLRFLSRDGQPEAVRIGDGSTSDMMMELDRGESKSLTLDPDPNRFQGWALTLLDGPVSSSVHFLQAEGEGRDLVPVATVSASTWAETTRVYIVQGDPPGAALAIVNFWNEPASVGILLSENQEIGRFDLEPRHQVTLHLAGVPGFPAGYRGPILIHADGEVAVTAVATAGGLPVSGLSIVAVD